jgi:two-component system OmpR family response regulator
MSRILVAEDDPHILRVISLWLSRQQHEVIEARNGITALEYAEREPPDILITDVNMPGMNGMQLLKHLLEHPDCPRGIIVLTNRWDHRELGEQVTRASVHVVPKPFSPSQLAELVRQLAGQAEAPGFAWDTSEARPAVRVATGGADET